MFLRSRRGFLILEIFAALIILTVIAVATVATLTPRQSSVMLRDPSARR